MSVLFLIVVQLLLVQKEISNAHDFVMSREQLTHEVEKLKEAGVRTNVKVEELEEENEKLAERNDRLEVREAILTETVEELKEENEKQAKRNDRLEERQAVLIETVRNLTRDKEQLENDVRRITDERTTGSTYIRWGRRQCAAGTETVYSGYAGGTRGGESGGGSNRLCMTSHPVFDGMTVPDSEHGYVYGAQYRIRGHIETDVVCALCRTAFASTFMVPGTNRCPSGSSMQYQGYLASHQFNYPAKSEYVCLDARPEERVGSSATHSSAWFVHVNAVCGSLPCPPYIDGRVVTCVVCSQ